MSAKNYLVETFGKVNDVDITTKGYEFNVSLDTIVSLMEGYTQTVQNEKAQEVAEKAIDFRHAQLNYVKLRDPQSQRISIQKALDFDQYLEQFIPETKAVVTD